MKSIPREKLLAKPEMKKALAKLQRVVREVLPDADFAEQEQVTLMLLDEVGRGVLEAQLAELAASFDDELLVDGVPYKRNEEGVETYHSLSGPLVVSRHTFRQMGVHNGPTVVPLELVAGIVEGATPALGYNVAHGYAQHDMRQHGDALVAAHRAPPPRATLERLAKRIAVAAIEQAPRIEAKLRRVEKVPEGAHAISLGLDRTSAPMAEERPEDAPPKPEPKRTKPRVRCAPAPIDVNYRMAYVGTVSILDAQGHAIETRRYAAPACDDPATLARRMCADVRALRGRCPTLNVGIVQDGAPEMWSVMREALAPLVQQGVLAGWKEGIDRCHLIGRLNTALDVCGLDAQQRADQLSTWKTLLTKADHECLTLLVGTLVAVTRLAQQHGARIARLRRMLGQTSSEKTANVVGAKETAATGNDGGPPASGQDAPVTDESPSGEAKDKPANDTDDGAKKGDKPRRKGHGRIPASAYASEGIAVPHPTLCTEQQCPGCAHGTLYALKEPVSCVRVFGQAPLVALRWDCARLRCSGCGHIFAALPPEEARGPKYSESAASIMIVLRYGMGMPLYRLETMQRFLGVPVPASTQWEVARDHVQEVLPVYNVLVTLAANAPLVHNDDTYVRILELMGKRRSKLVAAGKLDLPERTGLFTTGIVARTAAGPIALFASGRQHAGENLADLLDRRDPSLAPPMQMCDGLDRNLSDEHAVVLANCLAHGRRHVVDEVGNHPELCAHLLEEIGKVFANDATCLKDGVTGEARLAFHQRESGPVMASLRTWIEELFDTKRVEPNSGLGGALRYLLTRWEALTLFLRAVDAPIDNNLSERSLKHAIRQRRASLFYRSKNGALVGDVYTALIVTTQLHRGDPFRYLTALFTNYKAVAQAPADWLPWNYEDALARVRQCNALAA